MADQWYYSQQEERKGPVSQEELKRLATTGQLKPTDTVWKEGMAKWLPASQVKGLVPPPGPSVSSPIDDPSGPPPMGQAAANANFLPNKGIHPLLVLALNILPCGFPVGTMILGQVKKGLMVSVVGIVVGLVGVCLLGIPGIILWIMTLIDAYKTSKAVQDGEQVGENEYKLELLHKIMSLVDKSAVYRA